MKNPFPQIKNYVAHQSYEALRKALFLNLFFYYYGLRFFYRAHDFFCLMKSRLSAINNRLGRFQLKAPRFIYSRFVTKYVRKPLGYLMNTLTWSLRTINFQLTKMYWRYLLKDLISRKSGEIRFNEIKFLLWLNPTLINNKIRVEDEEVSLLDIIITKSPIRFDIVRALIQQHGANFDDCGCVRFMHLNTDHLIPWEPAKYWHIFYSNPIYYLAEYVRNLSFDEKAAVEYETAKAEFKAIVEYVATQEQPPKKGKGKANYQMKGGFPLLAYMPTWDLAQFLIDKGADPELENTSFANRNVMETLLAFDEYARLESFLQNGYAKIRDLKDKLIKSNALFRSASALLSPELSKQLSDLDKAHIITAALHREAQMYGFHFLSRTHQLIEHKLRYHYRTKREAIGLVLKNLLIDLATNSRDIYLMFRKMHLEFRLCKIPEVSQSFLKVISEWRKKDPSIFDAIEALHEWQCLPEGFIPRYDMAQLDEKKDIQGARKVAHEILGVSEGASPEQITHAYRRLSLKYHPDKNKTPAASAEMACLSKARDLLSPN